ncbi:hypothetical protein C8R46DRAFT_1123713 [Mycena filopes]|nr:hypothetical protein C8R46DRAFT_1123713 [Mycena filopes]
MQPSSNEERQHIHAGVAPIPPGLVNFAAVGLPEYDGCYAIVLDDLFTRPHTLLHPRPGATLPWDVAKVNSGTEAYTVPSYRNGQRIIYDSFELSAQIFDKIRPHLNAIEEIEEETYLPDVAPPAFGFLRYHIGGFFRVHCDGEYEDECASRQKTGQRTFYTVQLYLPSDATGSTASFQPAEGGSTRFWTDQRYDAYADVEPFPGRVLVFQHEDLEHTGEEVTGGVKCAMRSDILYEKVGDPVPAK